MSHPLPTHPWRTICLDFAPELPDSNGFTNCLIVVEKLLRRALFIPCTTDIDAAETAKLLYLHVFRHYGFPLRILCDRGPQFIGAVFKELWFLTATSIHFSTAERALGNGQAERGVGIFKQLVRSIVTENASDWDSVLPSLEFAYNDAINSATGFSPFYMERGYHPNSSLSIILSAIDSQPTSISSFHRRIRDSIFSARKHIAKCTTALLDRENSTRTPLVFNIGDEVLVKIDKSKRSSFQPMWDGPFSVTKVLSPIVLQVARGRKSKAVNIDRVRRYHHRPSTTTSSITNHRFWTADDGAIEIHFLHNNVWRSLAYIIQHADWPALQSYYSAASSSLHQHPKLVGRHYAAHYQGLLKHGIIDYYDPDDKRVSILLEDGTQDACTIPTARKYLID